MENIFNDKLDKIMLVGNNLIKEIAINKNTIIFSLKISQDAFVNGELDGIDHNPFLNFDLEIEFATINEAYYTSNFNISGSYISEFIDIGRRILAIKIKNGVYENRFNITYKSFRWIYRG